MTTHKGEVNARFSVCCRTYRTHTIARDCQFTCGSSMRHVEFTEQILKWRCLFNRDIFVEITAKDDLALLVLS